MEVQRGDKKVSGIVGKVACMEGARGDKRVNGIVGKVVIEV